MVARILTGKSIRGLLHYNESKVKSGDAELILASRFGLDIEQLELQHKLARFEHLTKLNSRVRTNAIHIMLNFDAKDNIATAKMQMIATDYMEKIGFGDQPFLVYQHEDASHPHLHIVTTNIKPDASRINMHNIGKTLSEDARKRIETDFQLIRAEGRGKEYPVPLKIDPASYGDKPTKRSIQNVVTAVLRDYKFTSLPEFNAALSAFNVIADRGSIGSAIHEKGGLVYSIIEQNGARIGIPFKASALAGRPTLKVIESRFERNKVKREIYTESLKLKIKEILDQSPNWNNKELIKAMASKGITLMFRQSDKGPIYGVTYVDHVSRCVFNGSDLGKQFSAKSLLQKLENSPHSEHLTVKPAVSLLPADVHNQPVNPNEISHHDQVPGTGLLETLLKETNGDQLQHPGKLMRKKGKKKRKNRGYDLGNKI